MEIHLNAPFPLASQAPEAGENEYVKDGLLYCKFCDKPKEKFLKLNGEMYRRPLRCDCQQAKYEEEELARKAKEAEAQAQLKEIERQRSIDALRVECFSDCRMRGWAFDKDDKTNTKISEIAHRYVDNFAEMMQEGVGLLLYGGVGTGKTFISACIANALIDKEHPCLVTNFSRMCNVLQASFSGRQENIDALDRYDLLVIDDLAAERDTEYMGEIVQTIIDSRYRAGKPLIITTNLTGDELKHPKDVRKERIYSRLFEMCIPVEVTGIDRRKRKLRDERAHVKQLLGL